MANTLSVTLDGTTKKITIDWTADTNTWASIEIHLGSSLFGTNIDGFSYLGGSTGATETYTFASYGTYTIGLYTTVDGAGAYRALETITLNTPLLYTCYLFYDSIKATYLASGILEDLGSGDTFRIDEAFWDGDLDLDDEVISSVQTNRDGSVTNVSITDSITVPSWDFSIAYIREDLDLECIEKTKVSVLLRVNNSLSYNATYTWKTGNTTKTGTTVTFDSLTAGTRYTFSLIITDSRGVIVGIGSISVTTEEEITAKTFIWTGSTWAPAIPYIWTGSTWEPATPYIYSSGWK